MNHVSPHSVSTLKELMDERDKRYEQHFRAHEEAVKLAREVATQSKGMVSIVALVAVISFLISIWDHFK